MHVSISEFHFPIVRSPTIVQNPTSVYVRNVKRGDPVTLSVTARGHFLKYQWRKNGHKISRATSSTYPISQSAYDDTGEYQCVVSNDAGEVSSEVVQLSVCKLYEP